MKTGCRNSGFVVGFLLLLIATAIFRTEYLLGAEVTLQGSMACNGVSISDPKEDDQVMVIFAIDLTLD